MENGVVKWFNNEKGYGFIRNTKMDEDIFVHFTGIAQEGFRRSTGDFRNYKRSTWRSSDACGRCRK